jgi:GNAT superfamily N-acetyltransferase
MLEELSLNHWQSLSTLLYDGWVLRFADGYTKRANSINPLYASTLDWERKLEACEKLYAEHQLHPTFKITPFVQPEKLDGFLEQKGYALIDPTSVQVAKLDTVIRPEGNRVTIDEAVQDDRVDNICRLNQVEDKHRDTMKRMLSNIRTKRAFVSLYHDEQVIACGLGVVERGFIGLYDIVTDARFRNKGYGKQLVGHLLYWGKEHGAAYSYLAVLRNNAPALRLYANMGYSEVYSYWYRVKKD